MYNWNGSLIVTHTHGALNADFTTTNVGGGMDWKCFKNNIHKTRMFLHPEREETHIWDSAPFSKHSQQLAANHHRGFFPLSNNVQHLINHGKDMLDDVT